MEEFIIEIIDLGPLKLNVKWKEILDQGTLNGDSSVYTGMELQAQTRPPLHMRSLGFE
jgi:hypothetical protein